MRHITEYALAKTGWENDNPILEEHARGKKKFERNWTQQPPFD